MRIAIFGNTSNQNTLTIATNLINSNPRDCVFSIHQPLFELIKENLSDKTITTFNDYETLIHHTDYLFSIGGDGTLLNTVPLVRDSGIPILGINTGRLGFLSSITNDELVKTIELIRDKNFILDKRSLLKVTSNQAGFTGYNHALNDFTIQKRDSSSMIIIHAYLNERFLNSFWSDGIIISTTTGSTAYSLSCGGPIMLPEADIFVITPIAPHNLNVRPIVIPSNCKLSLKAESRSKDMVVTLDTTTIITNLSNEFSISQADYKLNLIRLNENDFFNTLRNKLMWGFDRRNY